MTGSPTSTPTSTTTCGTGCGTIVREAEKVLDGADPGKIWDQFAAQLEEQATAAVAANFLWATERARWLAAQVADLFEEDGAQSLPQLRTARAAIPEMIAEMERPGGEKFGVGQRAFVGLRGGYIGTLMAGMASTFMGLTLLNPILGRGRAAHGR